MYGEANYGNTLWAKKTAFTRSAITTPKVNRFGWNLECCEPNVGNWPWQILGSIRAVPTVWEGAEIFFYLVNNAQDFTDFPSEKNYDIWTQQRQSVSSFKLSEQNFESFNIRGRFFQKTQKLFKTFQALRLQAVITPHWLQMPKTHGQIVPLRDV